MSRVFRKFIKGSWYNIGTIESWLSDMAKEGLVLKDLKGNKAYFERNKPVNAEYRIKMFDYYPKDEGVEIEENRNVFNELGWEFVTRYNNVHIFRNINSDFTELPLNENESGYRLQKLNQRYLTFLSIGLLSLAYILFGVFPRKSLVLGELIFLYSLIGIFAVTVIWTVISYFLHRRRIIKNTFTHHEKWKMKKFWRIFSISVYYLIFIAALILD